MGTDTVGMLGIVPIQQQPVQPRVAHDPCPIKKGLQDCRYGQRAVDAAAVSIVAAIGLLPPRHRNSVRRPRLAHLVDVGGVQVPQLLKLRLRVAAEGVGQPRREECKALEQAMLVELSPRANGAMARGAPRKAPSYFVSLRLSRRVRTKVTSSSRARGLILV